MTQQNKNYTLAEQLAQNVEFLKYNAKISSEFALQESSFRKAHVRATFSVMSTDEKAKYAKALNAQGLNQTQIADELGVKQPTICNYLKRS